MSILASWPRTGYLAVPPVPDPEPEPDPDPGEQPPDVPVATMTLHGTHPTVAANPHDGHAVTSLMARDGILLMGYGDWTYNTGPLDLLGLDLATGEPVTLHTGVRTECIEVWRVIDGDLYVPWIDTRSGHDHLGGGYLTDADGTWHEVVVDDLIHTFDVATTDGTDLLAVGSSRTTNRACVKRSTDGGATWEDVTPADRPEWMMRLHQILTPGDGSAWAPDLGARLTDGQWVATPGVYTDPTLTVVYGSLPIRARTVALDGVHYTDGLAISASGQVTAYDPAVVPQTVDGATLYGTRRQGGTAVLYTSPGVVGGELEWAPLLTMPADILTPAHLTHSQRVEVHDGTLYVGGTQGRVWKVTL